MVPKVGPSASRALLAPHALLFMSAKRTRMYKIGNCHRQGAARLSANNGGVISQRNDGRSGDLRDSKKRFIETTSSARGCFMNLFNSAWRRGNTTERAQSGLFRSQIHAAFATLKLFEVERNFLSGTSVSFKVQISCPYNNTTGICLQFHKVSFNLKF
jgi:hypothetical protein